MIKNQKLVAIHWIAGENATRYENTYLFTEEEYAALEDGALEARQQAEYDAWVAVMDEQMGNDKWRRVTG